MTASDDTAALDDITFLARSTSRVRVLETLASGPHDRTELQAATGIPRATVGRIVTEFEARGWVKHDGRHYTTSPLGAFLVTEFRSLVGGVKTMQKLRSVIEWLPTDEFDFSLERFADADITLAGPSDVIAPVRRGVGLFETADQVRVLGSRFVRESIQNIWRETVYGNQTAEVVVTADIVEAVVADPDAPRWFEELVAAENASVYYYDGTAPYVVAIVDDIAWIGLIDEDGAPQGLLETTDEAFYSWAEATIDTYRREAEPLDPAALTS